MVIRVTCTIDWPTKPEHVGYEAIQKLRGFPNIELLPGAITDSNICDRKYDVILIAKHVQITGEVIDRTGLRIVSSISTGFEHIDVEACRQRNVPVGRTPDVLNEATAETAVALLLMASRMYVQGTRAVRDGTWARERGKNPMFMIHPGIEESTVGIVGLGGIGQSIAKKVAAFDARKILYFTRNRKSVELENKLGVEYAGSLEHLLQSSDHVVLACALNESTRGLINKETLALFKPSACLVNISRGGVINQEALYDSLSSGRLRAAGLDVCTPEPLPTDHPQLTLPNVVITPHIGSATPVSRNKMWMLAVDNAIAALKGETMVACVA